MLLLLLSWWYGQSSVEERLDPVQSANDERDAAIKERDDAQRAWGEMGMRHERAMQKNLDLRAELSKASKDLPWLEKQHSELAEENIVQHNEIQRLNTFKQQYDHLLEQVNEHGMSAKRPEYYQQLSERVQRKLEIANNLLGRSESCVKALKEKLATQPAKVNMERDWLRAKLVQNARSTSYWAKHRRNESILKFKPAWGIRCACTEPEIAYGLKDQSPQIVELEATVAARDLTIRNLRDSRHIRNPRDSIIASTSNGAKTSLPSTEDSETAIADSTENDEAKLKELVSKNEEIKDLQQEKLTASQELALKNKKIKDLQKEKKTTGKEGASKNKEIKDLQDEKLAAGKELASKDKEIKDLQEKKKTAEDNATSTISSMGQELSESRKDLVDAREEHAECERELGQQKTIVKDLETARRGLEDSIKLKDAEIEALEQANQELADQPAVESPETLRRLTTANNDLKELRREHAECQGQSEAQAARIGALEAAGRHLGATIQAKDDRIAELEGQVNNSTSNELVQCQINSHNAAISKKDNDYQALNNHCQNVLGQLEAKRHEDEQSLNNMQRTIAVNQSELQRLWADRNNLRVLRSNYEGQIAGLTGQLRQGGIAYTDLQTNYNAQATVLDEANQNVSELQNEIARLQKTNTSLEQMNLSSESTFEKYRVEGADRARPMWQANFDREMSKEASKLEASQLEIFKLEQQLQEAQAKTNPIRESQLEAREKAVEAREVKLNLKTDAMDHDQQGSKAKQDDETLEQKLATANDDANAAVLRNRGVQNTLKKERQERKDEQARHEKELKKEQQDSENRIQILKLRLEKDNPLKGAVSKLQNDIAKLSKELEERKARDDNGR